MPFQFHQVPAGDDCKTTFQRMSEWLTAAQFSVKPGKLTEDKTTFTAKTFSLGWKNQRRKRREQKRVEEERLKVLKLRRHRLRFSYQAFLAYFRKRKL